MFRFLLLLLFPATSVAQLNWRNADSAFGPLPSSIHVFYTDSRPDSAPFRAYYVAADLKDKNVDFTTDTTYQRRLTPNEFYTRNDRPIIVVNGTFFSFETNSNLNVVINNGRLLSANAKTIKLPGDTNLRVPLYSSAIGITKNRKADVAWIKTDTINKKVWASQNAVDPLIKRGNYFTVNRTTGERKALTKPYDPFKIWKINTAIGGGPVLVQNGNIKITNEEEKMFAGKGIKDKHPRTAMGYTKDGKLIILVVEGRNPLAGGATLLQEAQILKDLGCIEALNLDGGGSSCLLINGKETITPSDKVQRAVPAVFLIKHHK